MGRSEQKAPKTYSLRITEHALQNIDQITGYVAYIRHEPLNAIHIGEEIFKTIDRIKKNPLVFHECQELPTKTKIFRKANCLSWLIIYKIRHSEIIILGVIHGHRRPSKIKSVGKVN